MDGGAWWAAVHGVMKSRTWLSDFTFTLHFYALEKEMATHSSVLAWRIPGMAEPSGLLSMGSHRVGHHWSDLVAAAACKLLSRTTTKKTYTCQHQDSSIIVKVTNLFRNKMSILGNFKNAIRTFYQNKQKWGLTFEHRYWGVTEWKPLWNR